MSRRPPVTKLDLTAFQNAKPPARRTEPSAVFDAQLSLSENTKDIPSQLDLEKLGSVLYLNNQASVNSYALFSNIALAAVLPSRDPRSSISWLDSLPAQTRLLFIPSAIVAIEILQQSDWITFMQTVVSRGIRIELDIKINQESAASILTLIDLLNSACGDVQPMLLIRDMGTPNIQHLQVDSTRPADPLADAYNSTMFELALCPQIYLKLAGLPNLLPSDLMLAARHDYASTREKNEKQALPIGVSWAKARKIITGLMVPVVEAFGTSRLIFGSGCLIQDDWREWEMQLALYLAALCEMGLEGDDLDRIFYKNGSALFGQS